MRTTTREIVRVCADLARLDRKGKLEVMRYLEEEFVKMEPMVEPKKKEPANCTEGGTER